MRTVMMIAYTTVVVSIVSIAPGTAQQKSAPYFKDGVINFDQKRFKQEFDQHERDAANPSRAARSLRKNEFCIVCDDGTRINCRSLFAGEPGRLACGAKGIILCSNHTGRVDFGKCP
jgi:hypothetical protein